MILFPECKDDAAWCTDLFGGFCYDPEVERTCCASCAQVTTNDDSKYRPKSVYALQAFQKLPLCCFAKISITNGTFQPNFTHTHTHVPFLVFNFKVYRV